MSKPIQAHSVPPTGWRRTALDSVSMAVYIAVVYGASLAIGPLGRDFSLLANPDECSSWLLERFVAVEVQCFHDVEWAYHLVNLCLLYACMHMLYRLTIRLSGGPWWLGTLAAALFMANPVHSESALNLCGAVDLAPSLLALAAVVAHVENAFAPRPWKTGIACFTFGLAVLSTPENSSVLLVLILFEVLLRPQNGKALKRLALPTLLTAINCIQRPEIFSPARLDPSRMFPPLYLVLYPIGFLPSTARAFIEHPALGWVSAAAVVLIVALIYRKARRPLILFGLLSAVSVRLFQGNSFVDPVHMIGGGKLLVANAFLNIAIVVLFRRIMDHRKWRRPVVTVTTLLCAALFVLEFRSVLAWRQASSMTHEFQKAIALEHEKSKNEHLFAIIPNLQYYAGAPMCLSESVSYETPFSGIIDVESPLSLNYAPGMFISIRNETSEEYTLTVSSEFPVDLLCYPYVLSRTGGVLDTDIACIRTTGVTEKELTLRVRDKTQGTARAFVPPSVRGEALQPPFRQ